MRKGQEYESLYVIVILWFAFFNEFEHRPLLIKAYYRYKLRLIVSNVFNQLFGTALQRVVNDLFSQQFSRSFQEQGLKIAASIRQISGKQTNCQGQSAQHMKDELCDGCGRPPNVTNALPSKVKHEGTFWTNLN